MTRHLIRSLAWMLIAGAIACGRESSPPRTASREASPQAGDTHEEEEDAIHLGEDLLRDLRISTAVVAERSGALEVNVLGEIAADQRRYAEVAPSTGGQVVRVLAELSAPVRAGTPLAQLRSADLGRARADLLAAEARRDLAQQTLDRKRTLAAERIVAAREVQEADATLRAAVAEVRATEAALRALGITEDEPGGDSSLFYLRSPVAGRVIDRDVILGQYADITARLFTVADLSRVWLIAQVFERDAVNVQDGSTAHTPDHVQWLSALSWPTQTVSSGLGCRRTHGLNSLVRAKPFSLSPPRPFSGSANNGSPLCPRTQRSFGCVRLDVAVTSGRRSRSSQA
jgi:cobalt-zinc-cadmium efflux system membrane fusion protein